MADIPSLKESWWFDGELHFSNAPVIQTTRNGITGLFAKTKLESPYDSETQTDLYIQIYETTVNERNIQEGGKISGVYRPADHASPWLSDKGLPLDEDVIAYYPPEAS